jgi:type IV fimbrial biogenesis protein FimT
MRHYRKTKECGVTLIELMFTLTVMGVLLAIAIPSFESLIASSRLSTSTNDLLSTIAQSRSEAIRRGQRIVLCIQDSANPGQCSAASGWEQGWLAYIDTNRDGVLDAGETTLISAPRQTTNISIPANGAALSITFLPSGRVTAAATLRVCSSSSALNNDARARDILINVGGQAINTTPAGIAATCPAP